MKAKKKKRHFAKNKSRANLLPKDYIAGNGKRSFFKLKENNTRWKFGSTQKHEKDFKWQTYE